MKNPLKRKEVAIGLSVIIALVILFVGIDYLKGINLFKPAHYYYAEYENVSDLAVAAPVTINGYKVGQVRDIVFDYDKPGKIKVIMTVNKKLRVPEDSEATIVATLMSGSYISVNLGSSTKMIELGGEIPSAQGHDLMNDLASNVVPALTSALTRVDSLVASLTVLVQDPALAQAIGRLDGISDNILSVSQGLNSTMNHDVPLIMRSANRSMTRIDSIAANLSLLSAQLKTLPLRETMDNLQSTSANLSDFSRQLNSSNSTVGQLTQDPELYNRINRVAADIDSLIVDIKRNPKRYISIKLL